MVLLLYHKERHSDNQVMIYWIINILTKILLITKEMETTVNASTWICIYYISNNENWILDERNACNGEHTLLLMENKVNMKFIMKQ